MYLVRNCKKVVRLLALVGILLATFATTTLMALPLSLDYWTSINPQSFGLQHRAKTGMVYARALVQGPNKALIYVEYNSDGKEVLEIGEAFGDKANLKIWSAIKYNDQVAQFNVIREKHPDHEVLSPAEYATKDFGGITKPDLQPETVRVVVRTLDDMIASRESNPILMELPINPGVALAGSTKFLLLNKDGQIYHQTANTIGYRSGFFASDEDRAKRNPIRAIAFAHIQAGTWFALGGHTQTNENGYYGVQYLLPPCPGFTYIVDTPIQLELHYNLFNPRFLGNPSYFMTHNAIDVCAGFGDPVETVQRGYHFPVDLIVLNGRAKIANHDDANPVKVGSKTEWNADKKDLKRIAQTEYDFDGDGTADVAILGSMTEGTEEEPPKFVSKDDGGGEEIQAVWLSGQHDLSTLNTGETPPDLIRIPDWEADLNDRALLKSISKEDLNKTDIFIFRESDGKLFFEKRGAQNPNKGALAVDNYGNFNFSMVLPGAMAKFHDYFKYGGSDWKTRRGGKYLEEEKLRLGDQIRVVAINRPTGYIGSTVTEISEIKSASVSFELRNLIMRPPNLKIWAERDSVVEYGKGAGKDKKQLIGNEGAGLTNDKMVSVYTEWVDSNGEALPEALANYGYTGRIAMIVAKNQLQDFGSDEVSQFAIKPGRKLQVLQFPEFKLLSRHLYVQVTGEPISEKPSFASNQVHSGILTHRPDNFVPFQVPVYDEEESLSNQKDKNAGYLLTGDEDQPIYQWFYRPEYQFSLYDLTMQEIKRTEEDDTTSDILKLERPEIDSSDKLIDLIYTLNVDGSDSTDKVGPLDSWSYSGDRELIFSVGGEEILATINGKTNTVRFENPEHLAALDSEDFLNIRLLSNNDAGNILWEMAFEYLSLETKQADYDLETSEKLYLSADNPTIDMQAILVGYGFANEESRKSLRWSVDGHGELDTVLMKDDGSGIFENTFTMPPEAGATGVINVNIVGMDREEVSFKPIEVIPGVPARLEVTTSNNDSIHMMGVGEMEVTVAVYDANNNPVADNTFISFTLAGSAEFLENNAFYGFEADNEFMKEDDSVLGTESSGEVDDSVETVFHGGTKNGRVTVRVIGGEMPSLDNQLSITTGDVVEEVAFVVHPLKAKLINEFAAEQPAGETTEVAIILTDKDENPVPGIPIGFSTDYGIFSEREVETGSDGVARSTLTNPLFPGYDEEGNPRECTLLIGTGVHGLATQTYTITRDENMPILNQNLMLIGDQLDDGHLTIEPIEDVESLTDSVSGEATPEAVTQSTTQEQNKIGLEYKIRGDLKLSGKAGETLEIKLGDLADPNIEPLAMYYMNDLGYDFAPEQTGLYPAMSHYVSVEDTNPMPNGSSYRFYKQNLRPDATGKLKDFGPSYLDTPEIPRMIRKTDLGFRLDFKAVETGGTLFDHGMGTQLLTFNEERKIVYQVRTDQGTFSIRSAPLALNTWHTVGARFHQGKLEMEINGQAVTPVPVQGELQGQQTDRLKVIIGAKSIDPDTAPPEPDPSDDTIPTVVEDGFEGYLNSVRFYDWTAPNIITLENFVSNTGVTTEKSADGLSGKITFQRDTVQMVTIASRGGLNTLQADSKIQMLRLSLKIGENKQFLSLLSSDYYRELGQALSHTLMKSSPQTVTYINLANPPRHWNPMDLLIPPVYAGDFTESKLFKVGWFILNFFVPLESFKILATQCYYMVKGDPRFKPVELALAAVEVLCMIPMAKPLKLVLGPLRKFIRATHGSPFVRALAGTLNKVVRLALKKKNREKVKNVLPFFMVALQIYLDPDARKTISFVLKTIQSPDDLMVWIDYIGMMVKNLINEKMEDLQGRWDRITGTESQAYNNGFGSQLGLYSVAYAAGNSDKMDRIVKIVVYRAKRALGRIANEIMDGVNLTPEKRKQFITTIKSLVEVVAKQRDKGIREMIRDLSGEPNVLKGSFVLGKKGIKKVFDRSKNLRMSPLIIMSVITYVESRRNKAICDGINNLIDQEAGKGTEPGSSVGDQILEHIKCVEFPEPVKEELPILYGRAVAQIMLDILQEKDRYKVQHIESGYLFHLAMIARQHVTYEVLGGEENKIVDLELSRKIQLYPAKFVKERNVDIVTAGDERAKDADGNEIGAIGEKNIWMEVKSLKSKSDEELKKTSWARWNFTKDKDKTLKKVSLPSGDLDDNKEDEPPGSYHRQYFLDRVAVYGKEKHADKFEWWLQDFKRKNGSKGQVRGYTASNIKTANSAAKRCPIGLTNYYYKGNLEDFRCGQKMLTGKIQLANIRNWIVQEAKDYLLNGIDAETIKKHITENPSY